MVETIKSNYKSSFLTHGLNRGLSCYF